jgi:hypothetical protein
MGNWPEQWRAAPCCALVLSFGLLGACVAVPPDPAIPAGAAENARPAGVMRSGTVPPPQPGQLAIEALRAAVRADAAATWQRTDSSTLQVSVEDVTWSDGSLGCPMPGQMYTQALVPGWRLIVSDGARDLTYHASRGGYWIQCPAGRARPPLPGSGTR